MSFIELKSIELAFVFVINDGDNNKNSPFKKTKTHPQDRYDLPIQYHLYVCMQHIIYDPQLRNIINERRKDIMLKNEYFFVVFFFEIY